LLLEPLVPEPELELPDDESLEPELEPLEPLLDGLFVVSLELDEELGLDGEADGEVLDEPDADEGLEGEVLEPDDEDGLDGEVLLEGALVAPRDELLPPLPLLSQPVTSAVPSARETAMASVDNLMWPPWLGYGELAASNGPAISPR
jgi:hypothetical protein